MTAHPLRFGLKLAGQDTSIEALRSVWRIADSAGFDHVWDFDHLASIGPLGPERPVYEGWTLLAAAAQATSRVRIGCMVTGNTYRHPALLAKTAVTVDHLSGGRLEFGIGAAWAEIEHTMLGIEGLDKRVGRLRESLEVIGSLWTQERTNFDGRYYRLADAIANPKPIQKPRIPIWIGARGDRMLGLVAKHADVWNVGESDDADLARMVSRLEEACLEIGRDPGSIRRSVQFGFKAGNVPKLLESAQRHHARGFTELVVYLGTEDPERDANQVAEALPDLRALEASN